MSGMVETLRDRRLNVVEQARALAERAAEENRNFEAAEQGQWDALNEEITKLDERIKAALDTEQRARDTDEQFDRLRGNKKPDERKGPADGRPGGDVNDELRSFLMGERGRTYDVRPESVVNFRDLSKLTSGAGGNLVPTDFYGRLMAHLIETSAIMQTGPTVLNTASGEVIQVPKTTAHSSASIVAETSAITESDPTFGQIPLGAYKYGTMIQVSRELLTDSGVDLEGYLSMQAGRALGNAFGAHMVTGDGTSKPRGVITDATTGVTGGTGVTGAFTADNLIDLQYSVISPYRRSGSCHWVMRDATLAAVRKLKDSTGQYIWQPSLVAGAPDLLLGKPVLTDPGVAAVAIAAKSVAFGDFSQYFVRLAGGVRFERSDDFAFSSDLVTFRALLRADAALVDLTGAIKVFAGGAS